jgi:hypothetical protein
MDAPATGIGDKIERERHYLSPFFGVTIRQEGITE